MISQCRGSSSSLAKTAETIEISGSKVPSLLANIRNKLSLAGSSQNLPRISGGSFERSAYGTPRGVANAVRWCCGARNGTRLCRATRHGCRLKSPLRRPGFRRMLQTCVTPSLIGCLQIRCCCDVRPDYWSNSDGRDPAPAIPSLPPNGKRPGEPEKIPDRVRAAGGPSLASALMLDSVEPLPAGRPSHVHPARQG